MKIKIKTFATSIDAAASFREANEILKKNAAISGLEIENSEKLPNFHLKCQKS